jgi:hypothetical protein
MVLTLDQEPRQRRRWGQLVARAWDDDGFRQRLLAEPEVVFCEEGIDVPCDVEFRVLEGDEAEDAGDGAYLRLPAKPGAEALFEDDLSLSDMLYARHTHKTSGGGCKKSL